MKPIRIVLAPTRSRPWNILLGLVLVLGALLIFLALATYQPTDPSLNTASGATGPHGVHNWIGLFGAYLSDLLLQVLGVTAFFLPLWLGGLGWTWMRSRSGGSAWLRWMGTVLALVFLPAVLGLLPWRWLWLGKIPVSGTVGMVVEDLLVRYLNIQGAWLVAGVLAAAGVCFASAVSFWTVREAVENRWRNLASLRDRWRNWREEHAERKEERIAEHEFQLEMEGREDAGPQLVPPPAIPARLIPMPEPDVPEVRPGLFARLFRRRRAPETDPQDIPAFQRNTIQPARDEDAGAGRAPLKNVKLSIWERADGEPAHAPEEAIPVTAQAAAIPSAPAGPSAEDAHTGDARLGVNRFEPVAVRTEFVPAAHTRPADEIAIHLRADAETPAAAVAPKNVSGFKLPPSTLLNAGEGPQAVREDELREEARVLVEKCAEFDVRGQVVQINPGPMVTTYEFKPEAGVKYSRVTGLADDLCLAMRAESILIERMAGKSTVGIQVPNHERETIHLRDVTGVGDLRTRPSRG